MWRILLFSVFCLEWTMMGLAINGECHIEINSASAVGTPRFKGQSQTLYSCVADETCNYDVHIISNYEGDGHTGFRVHNTGTTYVDINVSGSSLKPLIFVFATYEPVNWILTITSGVVIDKVLLGSYYLEKSKVTYSSGSVLNVERHNYQTLPSGYRGGKKLLEYVVGRFGPVASFSGSYRADFWTLNIHQGNTSGQNDSPLCTSGTTRPPSNSSPGTSGAVLVTVSVIVLILVVLPIIIIIIVVATCKRRANRFSHNQTAASHLPPSQVFYTQQSANLHYTHTRTSPAEHTHTQAVMDWTNKPEGLSQQVLVDSAPPAYHVALKFPQPHSKSDDPPPYPG